MALGNADYNVTTEYPDESEIPETEMTLPQGSNSPPALVVRAASHELGKSGGLRIFGQLRSWRGK